MKLEPGPAPPQVRGFRFSGVHGGLKSRGRRDFALVVADKPVTCAAAFTRNRVAAAPVLVARVHAASGVAQAVMVNSGNANAGTGEKGDRFVEWSCRELASRLSIDPRLVIPCSTGVIGVQLAKTPFARAISLGVDGLSRKGFPAAARAMMTSDAFPKWSHREVMVAEKSVDEFEMVVAGMAKGAGMINPNMATMLAVVVTDANVPPELARSILDGALALSFNRITVDGDTSTNDTVVLLASGQAAGGRIDDRSSPGYEELVEAVTAVMDDLSRMIVRDGEGATKMVDVLVEGAPDSAKAEACARAIANSVLVKTAFTGGDPNWGRIVCAIGNAGVDVDLGQLAIDLDDVALARNGTLVSEEALRMARKVMRRDAFSVRVELGKGSGKATVVTSDLTEAYVRFNSSYTS
jgi:glutamate N-acetyltransferase/amino-acid N-acetyltransferase